MNLGPAPDQLRYFLATPLMLLANALGWLTATILGERNCTWMMLNDLKHMGAEVMTEEEYKAKYGKRDEQEDKE